MDNVARERAAASVLTRHSSTHDLPVCVARRRLDGVRELETRLSMDAVVVALARHSFPVSPGRSHAFVSFVSFVVGCGLASVDGYSRRGINHEIHETHENVRIGLVWVLVPWRFASRLDDLHARREFGTVRVTADGPPFGSQGR